MSEQINFTEENKKTVISFIVGLIIGGLLVYIFALPTNDTSTKTNDSDKKSEVSTEKNKSEDEVDQAPTSSTAVSPVVRDGSVVVKDQSAGNYVELGNVTFPADEGWVGVRDYENGQLTGLLGVSRFNSVENLYPTGINLLRSTESGKTYAVVFYNDNGDKVFNLATDAQIQTSVTTFVAR